MGTITIGSIIDRARVTLLELDGSMAPSPTNVRWNRLGDLLAHANAAMREIVAAKPDAYVKNVAFQLAAGSKQQLPADGVQFFNVEHNLGANGATPGTAILSASRDFLSRADRNWMVAVGDAVERYVHDQRDRKVFYVYPRPNGPWQVNLVYSAVPPAISAANIDANPAGLIPIDDLYDSAIHDYIVGYALLKNSKAGEPGKATYFLTKFGNFIGRKMAAEASVAPLDPEAAEQAADAAGKP